MKGRNALFCTYHDCHGRPVLKSETLEIVYTPYMGKNTGPLAQVMCYFQVNVRYDSVKHTGKMLMMMNNVIGK
jgi:hypothetical protein